MLVITIGKTSQKKLLRILLFIPLSKHPYVRCITNILFHFLPVLYIDRYSCRFLITRTTLLVLLFEAYTTRFATTYNEATSADVYMLSHDSVSCSPPILFFFNCVI